MSKIKVKSAWYLGGVLIVSLTVLANACSMIEPPAPPLPVATIAPPLIPHSIEGRADCRACHADGLSNAPQFPDNHNQRPSDVCLACHVPTSFKNGTNTFPTMPPRQSQETTRTAVLATELYGKMCAACHGGNREGVPNLGPPLTPERLERLSDNEIKYTISDGRTGTTMPPFKEVLSPEEIEMLLQLAKSPLP